MAGCCYFKPFQLDGGKMISSYNFLHPLLSSCRMLHVLCTVEQPRPATTTSPFLHNAVRARPVLVAHPGSCIVPDQKTRKAVHYMYNMKWRSINSNGQWTCGRNELDYTCNVIHSSLSVFNFNSYTKIHFLNFTFIFLNGSLHKHKINVSLNVQWTGRQQAPPYP